MHHSLLLSFTNQCPGRAAVLEQFMFLDRTGRTEGGWVQTNRPRLRDFIQRTISICLKSISRHIRWLEEHGFIKVRREWTGRGWQLYVRVLFRVKEGVSLGRVRRVSLGCPLGVPSKLKTSDLELNPPTEGRPPAEAAHCSDKISGDILPEKEDTIPPAPLPSRLKGKVEDAVLRVRKDRARRAEEAASEPPTPYKGARIWNDKLREWGHEPFPIIEKELAHVKRAIPHLAVRTLGEVPDRLERVLEHFASNRKSLLPKKHQKLPCHPWVCNRYPSIYDTPAEVDLAPPPVAKVPEATPPKNSKPRGMFHLLNAKRKVYPSSTEK